jgi:hypothetical protein
MKNITNPVYVMRRIILASMLAVVLLVAFVPISYAEMAKEGSSTDTTYYISTYKGALVH